MLFNRARARSVRRALAREDRAAAEALVGDDVVGRRAVSVALG